jgi:4'-phosphopantetheinyl transferase EntD
MTPLPSMWDDILPDDVISESGDPTEPVARLFPAEAALMAGMVDKRRREFAMGRRCARRALERLGIRATPLLAGPLREPLWPDGVIGSITHTAGLCTVVVGRRGRLAGIGIDAEPDGELPADIVTCVCRPDELAAFDALAFLDAGTAARLAFSAKEAVYKCQYPTARRVLEFHDVAVTFTPDGAFTIRWFVEAPVQQAWFGRWRRIEGFVLTATWVAPVAEL